MNTITKILSLGDQDPTMDLMILRKIILEHMVSKQVESLKYIEHDHLEGQYDDCRYHVRRCHHWLEEIGELLKWLRSIKDRKKADEWRFRPDRVHKIPTLNEPVSETEKVEEVDPDSRVHPWPVIVESDTATEEVEEVDPDSLDFVVDDGGRKAAGYKGNASDCVLRSLSIALGEDYEDLRRELMEETKNFANTSRSRKAKRQKKEGSSVFKGVYREIYSVILKRRGWIRTGMSKIGSSKRYYLTKSDVPPVPVILHTRRHLTTSIDHTIRDTWDTRMSTVFKDGSPTDEKSPRVYYSMWTPPDFDVEEWKNSLDS